MNRKQELTDQIAALRSELSEIEEAETRARNAPLLGKCYRYRNSFGGGEDWWLYCRINDVSEGLRVTTFEVCSNGEVRIEPSQFHWNMEGYEEISDDEYFTAALECQGTVRKILGV